MGKNFMKKYISIVLCLILCVFAATEFTFAAETKAVTEYRDVSEFRSDSAYTYPKKAGYVFAGWYVDEACTQALGKDVKDGKAYAKFVDEKVLSFKGQVNAEATTSSDSIQVRLLTSVDSDSYEAVGFLVEITGKESKAYSSQQKYSKIYSNKGGEKKEYLPTGLFSTESKYIHSYIIEGFANADFTKDMKVTPMWDTLDGTRVQGVQSQVIKIERVLAGFDGGLDSSNGAYDGSGDASDVGGSW